MYEMIMSNIMIRNVNNMIGSKDVNNNDNTFVRGVTMWQHQ